MLFSRTFHFRWGHGGNIESGNECVSNYVLSRHNVKNETNKEPILPHCLYTNTIKGDCHELTN